MFVRTCVSGDAYAVSCFSPFGLCYSSASIRPTAAESIEKHEGIGCVSENAVSFAV